MLVKPLKLLTNSLLLTMSLMGLSSSKSMGTFVLWIHVLVHRCLSRTYEFLERKKSRQCVVLHRTLCRCQRYYMVLQYILLHSHHGTYTEYM